MDDREERELQLRLPFPREGEYCNGTCQSGFCLGSDAFIAVGLIESRVWGGIWPRHWFHSFLLGSQWSGQLEETGVELGVDFPL